MLPNMVVHLNLQFQMRGRLVEWPAFVRPPFALPLWGVPRVWYNVHTGRERRPENGGGSTERERARGTYIYVIKSSAFLRASTAKLYMNLFSCCCCEIFLISVIVFALQPPCLFLANFQARSMEIQLFINYWCNCCILKKIETIVWHSRYPNHHPRQSFSFS